MPTVFPTERIFPVGSKDQSEREQSGEICELDFPRQRIQKANRFLDRFFQVDITKEMAGGIDRVHEDLLIIHIGFKEYPDIGLPLVGTSGDDEHGWNDFAKVTAWVRM